MKHVSVGKTGVRLSKIGLGLLPFGPLQKNWETPVGAELIRYALSKGVNFLDCAKEYHVYDFVAEALYGIDNSDEVVVIDKSSARSYDEMEMMVAESLSEMEQDNIAVYLLYDVRSRGDFNLREGAWKYLVEGKEMGFFRAIGLSTHTLEGADLAAEVPDLDIVEAVFNQQGIGILDGNLNEMEQALRKAKDAGKTVCAIKPLGGGMLVKNWKSALNFVLKHPVVDCVCISMTTPQEVDINTALANGQKPSSESLRAHNPLLKRLSVLSWCDGCEDCIPVCPTNALSMRSGIACVDHSKCDLCGKCGAVCPEEALYIS